MREDIFGNPVSHADDAALAGVNDFICGFIAYQPRAVNILAAAEAAPDCCIAQVYAGMLWMFLESPEAPAKAQASIARAHAAAGHAHPREQRALAALEAWACDDIPRALALGEDGVRQHPRDLALMKITQYHAFNRGDALTMLRVARPSQSAAPEVAQVHGMMAFAYEQSHLLAEAETSARRALSLIPAEPWAEHALAHVMLTQGRIGEGGDFLTRASAGWTGLNSFMSTHNWWHLALFRISQDRMDEALAIHDAHVWGIDPSYSQDQVGAVSLLARLECAGLDVGSRWQALAPYLVARRGDVVAPFLTMQYLYGLARADRPEADELMTAVSAKAATAPAHSRTAWADIALPACRALLAHARGDYQTCIAQLSPALPRMALIGGSHAQRDLFEQILLDAFLKRSDLSAAQQLLEQRRRFDPDGAPLNRALADVYRKAGLEPEALTAQARAERTRASYAPV
jgi:tetratricopeptide (TPR) repeat protein